MVFYFSQHEERDKYYTRFSTTKFNIKIINMSTQKILTGEKVKKMTNYHLNMINIQVKSSHNKCDLSMLSCKKTAN